MDKIEKPYIIEFDNGEHDQLEDMEGLRKCHVGFVRFVGRSPLKEALAEFLGTFMLVLLGDGTMTSILVGQSGNVSGLQAAVGWGLALTVAIAICGGISGGHVNPAVTLAMATVRKCPWVNVLPYFVAQYLGAFLAAAVLLATYHPALDHFEGGTKETGGSLTANYTGAAFATYPQSFLGAGTCLLDQVVGTAVLLVAICAACDTRNMKCPPFLRCAFIGASLSSIALALGYNCGAPLNPARDLGPRVLTAIAGWGSTPFSFRDYMFFWIPIIGPHLGGILGVWIYFLFIETPMKRPEGILHESSSDEENPRRKK